MLFDIGIAGPIAGFLVAVPALFLGLWMSHVVPLPDRHRRTCRARRAAALQVRVVAVLGHAARRLLAEHASDGVCGLVRAAGDGAEPVSDRPARRRTHLLRGARPRGRSYVTLAMVGVADRPDASSRSSWIVWTGLMIVMLFMFGPHHPRVVRRARAARSHAHAGSRSSRS